MSRAEQPTAGPTAVDDSDLPRLAQLACDGDRGALAALLRSLQDVLYRVCRSRLGDDTRANDATQETALRMIHNLDNFRGESSPRTWAIGVALNVCREMQRKPAMASATPEQLQEQPTVEAGPAAAAATIESTHHVRRLVQELPTRQGEAITLRYLEQLSVTEAAEAMGCSAGTVKAAAWQGLRTLRTRLEGRR